MVESGYACSEQKRSAIAQAVGASYGSFWDSVPSGVRAISPQVQP